jgi:hypothetical protein
LYINKRGWFGMLFHIGFFFERAIGEDRSMVV